MNGATLNACSSVVEWVSHCPQVLDLLGDGCRDCCRIGRHSLQEVCWLHGLDVGRVCFRLATADEPIAAFDADEFAALSLARLCDLIEHEYHFRLRDDLTRGARALDRLLIMHGSSPLRLNVVATAFADLRDRIVLHLLREEAVVFPGIRAMERAGMLPRLRGAPMEHPLLTLKREHRLFEDVLQQLRELGYDCARELRDCADYVGLISTLHRLEKWVRRSNAIEARCLFPRTLALEARLSSPSSGNNS
jgi:iron-sulfur cluster repair protein YtfE (RIC family)